MINITITHQTIYKLDVPFVGYMTIPDSIDYIKRVTSCGICSVSMILKYLNKPHDIGELITEGNISGGFTENGWSHEYFIGLFKRNNIEAQRIENLGFTKGLDLIKESILAQKPLIISMQKFSFDRILFHMVVVNGFIENEEKEIVGLLYLDPGEYNEKSDYTRIVSKESFLASWRKMAIFL